MCSARLGQAFLVFLFIWLLYKWYNYKTETEMTPQVQREIVFVFKLLVLVCAFARDIAQTLNLSPLVWGRFSRQNILLY